MRARERPPALSGQALAALGATILKHSTTTYRRHTVTEAVTALTN